jgi:hypothetical protein
MAGCLDALITGGIKVLWGLATGEMNVDDIPKKAEDLAVEQTASTAAPYIKAAVVSVATDAFEGSADEYMDARGRPWWGCP